MLDDVLNRFYGEYNEFDRLLAAIKAKLDEHYTKKIFHLSDKNSINGHDSLCCCDECIALIRAAINPEDKQTGEQHGLLAAIQANIDKFQLSDFNSINGHEALCCCDECIALIRAAINPEDEQTGEQQ